MQQDFADCMNVRSSRWLPKEIAPEAMRLMFWQLQTYTRSQSDAINLVKIAAMEYPQKPLWWQLAKALWEKKKGIC